MLSGLNTLFTFLLHAADEALTQRALRLGAIERNPLARLWSDGPAWRCWIVKTIGAGMISWLFTVVYRDNILAFASVLVIHHGVMLVVVRDNYRSYRILSAAAPLRRTR